MARPNCPSHVIWITTDHMRWDFIAAHGATWMHTPNLDRLVRGGVSSAHCYANSPLCMPSRCSFMTGQYPWRSQVMENGQELRHDHPDTVARCFARGGYQPVQIGKLHFQNHQDHDLDPRARHDYGFECMALSEEPGCYEDAYRTWLRGERPDLVGAFTLPRPASFERHRESHEHTVVDAPWQYSHSGWVAQHACRYLLSWGEPKRPQFIHLGFYAPHPPLNPTAEMMEPYSGVEIPAGILPRDPRVGRTDMSDEDLISYKRHFAAMITGVDLAVGQLLDALEEHGLLDDTLIVFGSDHGDLCGDHGGIGKGTNHYDGVMRLPCIWHWPNGLGTGGRTIDGLMEMVDVLPTMLALSGCPIPSSHQGLDLSATIRGEADVARRDCLAVYTANDLMLRSERWKYLRYQRPDGETAHEILYDLANDPDEIHDVSAEPANAAVLQELRVRLLDRVLAASDPGLPVRCRF